MRRGILLISLWLGLSAMGYANSEQACGKEALPCVKYGAVVFQERCSLCHGSDGLGEGILSLSIQGYPNTNLAEVKHAKGLDGIREITAQGVSKQDGGRDMPPFADELTLTQIDSVALFVDLLRRDLDAAIKVARVSAANTQPTLRIGRAVYLGRCKLCHGTEGLGDGKLARVIKTPPPYNLTLSRLKDSALRNIISKGGEAVGRSAKMPVWEGDLSAPEIDSVILYIKTLRISAAKAEK